MTNPTLDDILDRLHALQTEVEQEIDRLLDEKRELFKYTLEQGKVRFEQGMKALQLKRRTGVWIYLRHARLRHIVTTPLIYSLIILFVALDVAVTLYQHICFRMYKIPRVKRADYFIIDRQHLAYLNAIEKVHCAYCGYVNGLIEYLREVSARTEKYWCPIKHAQRTPDPHYLTEQFVDYGDADAYKARLDELRQEWSKTKK
jgi:hypothetical protein